MILEEYMYFEQVLGPKQGKDERINRIKQELLTRELQFLGIMERIGV